VLEGCDPDILLENLARRLGCAGGADFHLLPGSDAVDRVDADPAVTVDFDGDTRPLPVGGRADIGADELKP